MMFAIVDEMIKTQEKFAELKKLYFFEHVIFSYQWWFLIFVTVFVWIVWAILVDKKNLNRILLVGLFTSLTAVVLDDIGLSLVFWFYPYQIAFFTNQLYPVDIAIIPVFYMLLYQYRTTWVSYLLTLVLLLLFAVIVAEPLFAKMDIYMLIRWEHLYSIPFYMLIGIFVKWLVDRLVKNNDTF